jgi:hypothetical protein
LQAIQTIAFLLGGGRVVDQSATLVIVGSAQERNGVFVRRLFIRDHLPETGFEFAAFLHQSLTLSRRGRFDLSANRSPGAASGLEDQVENKSDYSDDDGKEKNIGSSPELLSLAYGFLIGHFAPVTVKKDSKAKRQHNSISFALISRTLTEYHHRI